MGSFPWLCQKYKGDYVPGPQGGQSGHLSTHGGVAFLVRINVQHRLATGSSYRGVQSIGLWVQGIPSSSFIINIYSPPCHDPVTPQVFSMWWNQFHLDSINPGWQLVTSTWHKLTAKLPASCGCTEAHLLAKIPKGCSPSNIAQHDGQHDHVKVSDHIGFWIILNKPVSPTKRGRVKPGPRWTVPSWMSQDDWIQQLETSWKQLVEPSDEYRLFVALSQRPYSQNDKDLVQRQWDHFQKCLHMCFIFTYRQLLTTPGLKPDQIDEVKAWLKQNGLSSKATLAQFQWVNEPGHQIGDSGTGEHTRRLRRKIARLYEIRRECLGSRCPSMSLLHKVWPHKSNVPTSCAELQTLTEQMISTTQLEITSLEDHMKSYRLTQWKTRLNDPSLKVIHGSHGPDQWSGNEIRCIPHGAITAFHTCSLRWHFTGCVPQQFCASRQINIFKIHKIKNNGTISVADIRPISVLSGWWRVYSSAWVKSQQLRSWSKTYLHPAVASGTGIQGTEILAQNLQDLYVSRPGCVAPLDGSNAFDRMNPVTSTQAMLQSIRHCASAGMHAPKNLVSAIPFCWIWPSSLPPKTVRREGNATGRPALSVSYCCMG